MNPVRGHTMLNFLYWLAIHRPEVNSLRSLTEDQFLMLVDEFEHGRLGGNRDLRNKWSAGLRFLLDEDFDWEGYGSARAELTRIERRR